MSLWKLNEIHFKATSSCFPIIQIKLFCKAFSLIKIHHYDIYHSCSCFQFSYFSLFDREQRILCKLQKKSFPQNPIIRYSQWLSSINLSFICNKHRKKPPRLEAIKFNCQKIFHAEFLGNTSFIRFCSFLVFFSHNFLPFLNCEAVQILRDAWGGGVVSEKNRTNPNTRKRFKFKFYVMQYLIRPLSLNEENKTTTLILLLRCKIRYLTK